MIQHYEVCTETECAVYSLSSSTPFLYSVISLPDIEWFVRYLLASIQWIQLLHLTATHLITACSSPSPQLHHHVLRRHTG